MANNQTIVIKITAYVLKTLWLNKFRVVKKAKMSEKQLQT